MEKNNNTMNKDTVAFFDYLKAGVEPHHVVKASGEFLLEAGFEELALAKPFKINKGGRYFINLFETALCAFTIGTDATEGQGFHIAAAHTDHPCLHIKPAAELNSSPKAGTYMTLDTEVYGGPIFNTWLDRPLSIAGMVTLRSDDAYAPVQKYIDFEEPVAIIPNVAIHFNREVNKGVALNQQVDMIPFLGMFNEKINRDNYLLAAIAERLDVDAKDILDADLYVYCLEEPSVIGLDRDMISSPRLDNLTSCYALLKSVSEVERTSGINLALLFDHEEIGSHTKTGADSGLLLAILEKIYAGLGFSSISVRDAILSGFLFSVDVAHATHPNHPEKYDALNRMGLNEGITLKISSNQKYTFDTSAVATAQVLCEKAGIGYKKFVNRSDIPGGSTLGPLISALLPMHTVDIGVPILAMHSARELMGLEDEAALIKLLTEFYRD